MRTPHLRAVSILQQALCRGKAVRHEAHDTLARPHYRGDACRFKGCRRFGFLRLDTVTNSWSSDSLQKKFCNLVRAGV